MRCKVGVAALLLAWPCAAAAEPTYAVAYSKADFHKGEKIGLKKAGLLCLPNGPVRWGRGDFFVDPAELSAAVGASLARTGMKVSPAAAAGFGQAGVEAATHLIGLTVTGARFDLCAPKWGLGDRSRLRGTGRLAARWEVFSKAEQKIVFTTVTEQSVTAEVEDFGTLVESLVERSAEDFARKAAAGG